MPESWKDLDRLVSAGRQLVDGVSGARPGSRNGNRGQGRRLAGLGRWVENKLDWILEDEADWREPWQETRPEPISQGRPRRRLDAISRRSTEPPRGQPQQEGGPGEWPDDDAFAVPHWQRQQPSAPQPSSAGSAEGRAMPRSTRRRGGG